MSFSLVFHPAVQPVVRIVGTTVFFSCHYTYTCIQLGFLCNLTGELKTGTSMSLGRIVMQNPTEHYNHNFQSPHRTLGGT